jgi:hypothetical protein
MRSHDDQVRGKPAGAVENLPRRLSQLHERIDGDIGSDRPAARRHIGPDALDLSLADALRRRRQPRHGCEHRGVRVQHRHGGAVAARDRTGLFERMERHIRKVYRAQDPADCRLSGCRHGALLPRLRLQTRVRSRRPAP